jgi:hypothetical protein
MPTGAVTFKAGDDALGSAAVSPDGTATLEVATLASGSHAITAAYVGNAEFAGSASAPLTQIVEKAATTTTIATAADAATAGRPTTFTATVSGAGGTPTGTVTFKDGADAVGTATLSDGIAKLTLPRLSAGDHSVTAQYGRDARFAGSTSSASAVAVGKAATTVTIAASANPLPAGLAVTFTARLSASGGTPTGTVVFRDGADTLGSAAVSPDGSAKLEVATLSVGSHTITAVYEGDASFAGSTSAPLVHVVDKAATSTTVTASPNPGTVGQAVVISVQVVGSGGMPTGVVTFRDGAEELGRSALSADGSASLTVSRLSSGRHAITAAYGGDGNFAPSVSPAYSQALELPRGSYQPILILVATIVLAALLVLMRGVAMVVIARLFRWLVWPILWAIRWVFRRILMILRFLRILSRVNTQQRPAEAFLGLSVNTISRALTETEDAIRQNPNPANVAIRYNRRLVCFWLAPQIEHKGEYEKPHAERDIGKAERFFTVDIPVESNPLNLYDDVHNAFIVGLFGDSDKACFHVLTEFRKTINSNVVMLSVVFSLIVSVVAVLNILWSKYVDFYKLAGVPQGRWLPPVFAFLGLEFETKLVVNTAIFGAATCLAGLGLMWLFYNIAYDQSQRHNGQQMNNFLVRYLSDLNINFAKIHAHATRAVVEEADIDKVKKDTVLWITNLQWMAFRTFFIEEFLRSVIFQVRRNSIYALFLIPAFFIVLMLTVAWLFGVHQFDVFDLESSVYRQNTFYVFFPWLVYAYYRYMNQSLDPMRESIDGQWSKFRELNVQGAMRHILESYANQLDQWRSRFRDRGGGPQN